MQATEFFAVIPARYASSRLPGKPLVDVGGLPMVVRVYNQASKSGAAAVLIATDDPRIADVVRAHGAAVEMTSAEHESGTDRIAEVAIRRAWRADRIVVNVQGDEPLIPPALIRQTAELLGSHTDASIATLTTPLTSEREFDDPNIVKVVTDSRGYALYFSRAPIPWPRDGQMPPFVRRHVGIYAYRVSALSAIASSSQCELEKTERLEQLRALWLGHRIVVSDAVEPPPIGVDTQQDLELIRDSLKDR